LEKLIERPDLEAGIGLGLGQFGGEAVAPVGVVEADGIQLGALLDPAQGVETVLDEVDAAARGFGQSFAQDLFLLLAGVQAEDAVDPVEALIPKVTAGAGIITVPGFRGLTMAEARRLAAEIGLVVRFEGTGVATAQSTMPAGTVDAEEGVLVTFRSHLPNAVTRSGDAHPVLPGGPELGLEAPRPPLLFLPSEAMPLARARDGGP